MIQKSMSLKYEPASEPQILSARAEGVIEGWKIDLESRFSDEDYKAPPLFPT